MDVVEDARAHKGDMAADAVGLDYDTKVKLLEQAHQDLLLVQEQFAAVSGEYAQLKATIQLIKMRISALQSAIKAEGFQR